MNIDQIKELAGHRDVSPWVIKLVQDAVEIEREALAEQKKQEPVAWALSHSLGVEFSSKYPMQTTKEAAEQMAREHMGNVVVTPLASYGFIYGHCGSHAVISKH